MNRTPLKERLLPSYCRGEEIMNMVTHIVGGGIGLITLVACIIKSVMLGDGYSLAGSIVFGVSMLTLYVMSSIYHGLSRKLMAKKVFQVLDHCTIFVLIAGTYTPVILCRIRPANPIMAWILFAIVWGAAALGIVLNSIDLERYIKFSMVSYLSMGWCILLAGKTAYDAIGALAFFMILLGGVMYSVGAAFYAFTGKRRYMHAVFHIFVCLASVLHSAAVFFFVI